MKIIKILFVLYKQIGVFSLIKTIKFNFKYFKWKDAVIFPVLISKNVLFNKKKSAITLNKIHTGAVKIGFGNVGIFDKKYERTVIEFCEQSQIVFNGSANIGHGTKISVQANAKILFGDNFCITANTSIVCAKQIEFGRDCLLSWNILILDSDLHEIIDEKNSVINAPEQILIGNNVWIGAKTTILKGVVIPDGNIIGANSLVNKKVVKLNNIIAGSPAKIVKEKIKWRR